MREIDRMRPWTGLWTKSAHVVLSGRFLIHIILLLLLRLLLLATAME